MEAGLPQTGPTFRMPSGRVCASLRISFCLLLQVVLNQKFTDCFVLVFLDSHLGKTVRTGGGSEGLCVSLVGGCTPNAPSQSLLRLGSPAPRAQPALLSPPPPRVPQSLTVVFREPFPVQPQDSESPPAQLVSTYHHLESVINTACFTLWTRLL